jgi:O-antigen ligase
MSRAHLGVPFSPVIRGVTRGAAPIASGRAGRSGALTTPYPATLAAIAITAALAPAYVIRWRVGPLPTTVLEVAILGTLAVFVLECARSGAVPDVLVRRSPLLLPAAVFLLAGAIAVLAAPSRTAALGIYRAYLVEPAALALVILAVVRSPAQAWLVVCGLWAGGCVLAVANAQLVLTTALHHQLDVRGPAPAAIYLSPNSVALFLVPLLALAGAGLLHDRSRTVRLVSGAFVLVVLPATVLTFSRGGWTALGAVAVGVALSHRRRWWLLGGLACLGAAAFAVPYVQHRALLLLRSGDGNTSGDRVRLWALTLRILASRPLLGTGLAGFEPTARPLWSGDGSWILYPHNLALDLWAETGLLGLLSFAWLFLTGAVLSLRGWWASATGWRALHLGVLLALLAVLVHGAVDNPFFKNDLSLELWTLLALTGAGWRWRRE